MNPIETVFLIIFGIAYFGMISAKVGSWRAHFCGTIGLASFGAAVCISSHGALLGIILGCIVIVVALASYILLVRGEFR